MTRHGMTANLKIVFPILQRILHRIHRAARRRAPVRDGMQSFVHTSRFHRHTHTVCCTRRCCARTSFEACLFGRIGRSAASAETQSRPEDSSGVVRSAAPAETSRSKSCGKAPEDSRFSTHRFSCKRIWCKLIADQKTIRDPTAQESGYWTNIHPSIYPYIPGHLH